MDYVMTIKQIEERKEKKVCYFYYYVFTHPQTYIYLNIRCFINKYSTVVLINSAIQYNNIVC